MKIQKEIKGWQKFCYSLPSGNYDVKYVDGEIIQNLSYNSFTGKWYRIDDCMDELIEYNNPEFYREK